MTPVSGPADPRAIVTPDAFDVSTELLGLPLAPPWRRMTAILIDLVVIGILTAVTKSFALVLGVVAAVLFIRAGFKRTPVRGNVFGRAMRLSVGCLGVFVAIVTATLWAAFGFDFERERPDADELMVDIDEQVAAALDVAGVGGMVPIPLDPAEAVAMPDTAELPPDVAEAVRALAAENERLRTGVTTLTESLADQAEDRREGGGLLEWLRGFLDELGFGFGWASLYMTVLLSAWKGQTVGKRLMGIRVLRLDGEPITWWLAFERAGGYAAGFATGLLGFAQVYWDANRQAIHDRIAGTVVVMHGAEPVGDWEAVVR